MLHPYVQSCFHYSKDTKYFVKNDLTSFQISIVSIINTTNGMCHSYKTANILFFTPMRGFRAGINIGFKFPLQVNLFYMPIPTIARLELSKILAINILGYFRISSSQLSSLMNRKKLFSTRSWHTRSLHSANITLWREKNENCRSNI